jgi:hypothetical protein
VPDTRPHRNAQQQCKRAKIIATCLNAIFEELPSHFMFVLMLLLLML